MILDPEKVVSDYTEDEQAEIVEQVWQDFQDAEANRAERQEIALEDLELYSRMRRDAEAQAKDRQGWSKVEVPIVYWNVEHQVPRLGVDPPTVTVKPLTPEAVPYALAKQLRLQWYLGRCGWDIPYQMILRSRLILGDGIAMVPWSPQLHMPRLMHVDWFDFFVSAEAMVLEEAECHMHRTFFTPRGLEQLAGQLDEDDRPIWHNLEDLEHSGMHRSQVDDSFERRRGLASQGEGQQFGMEIPFVSFWYSTGEYIVVGGPELRTLVRAQMSPYRRRVSYPGLKDEIVHLRPFAFFRNILDLNGPYSLSEPRALGDHQVEMSTLRNQAIDQVSGDLNAPIVFDESLDEAVVKRAFSTPKGTLKVPFGPSGPLIMRMPPGQPSSGLPMIYDQIRNESQLISGLNDNAAGAPVNTEQTATEVTVLDRNAGMRMGLKRKMDEIAMGDVARMFDARDRQFGGIVRVELPSGVEPGGLRGFAPLPGGAMDPIALMAGRGPGVRPGVDNGLVQVGPEVNGPGRDYEVVIDAGSNRRPDQGEEVQRLNAFLAGATHPEIAARVNWDEVARSYIEASGFSPDRLLRPAPPPAAVGPDGQPIPPAPPAPPA